MHKKSTLKNNHELVLLYIITFLFWSHEKILKRKNIDAVSSFSALTSLNDLIKSKII